MYKHWFFNISRCRKQNPISVWVFEKWVIILINRGYIQPAAAGRTRVASVLQISHRVCITLTNLLFGLYHRKEHEKCLAICYNNSFYVNSHTYWVLPQSQFSWYQYNIPTHVYRGLFLLHEYGFYCFDSMCTIKSPISLTLWTVLIDSSNCNLLSPLRQLICGGSRYIYEI